MKPWKTGTKPFVYAHRGYRAIAPENTLTAASLGHKAGAEAWELDVAESADGVLVVIHDDTLTRTTDAAARFPDRNPWSVYDFTLAELQSLDAGSWYASTDPFRQIGTGRVTATECAGFAGIRIPTLEDCLRHTRELGWKVNVEIKDASGRECDAHIVERTLDLVRQLAMEGMVLISSFNHEYLVRSKAKAPEVPVGVLTDEPPEDILERLARIGALAWHPNMKKLNEYSARAVLDAGFGLNPWTVNEESDMNSLIAWGASGIITDFVERARTLVDGERR